MLPIAFILNLPFTLSGLVLAALSIFTSISFDNKRWAIIFHVKSFWWTSTFFWLKGARATTTGHVVLLGPLSEKGDLEHELVHVEQWIREPFIHPFLYFWQAFKYGYRHNKYEVEAYSSAHNKYVNADGEAEVL